MPADNSNDENDHDGNDHVDDALSTVKGIRGRGPKGPKEGEGQVAVHGSRNADDVGFYCIGRDIKVRVTSGCTRSRSPPASIGSPLLLPLLRHDWQASERASGSGTKGRSRRRLLSCLLSSTSPRNEKHELGTSRSS